MNMLADERYVRQEDHDRFQAIVAKYQLLWRGPIIERDGFKCVCCGATGNLDLAHINSKRSFHEVRGNVEDIILSFRDDNLASLCRACHEVADGQRSFIFDAEILRLLDAKKRAYRLEAKTRDFFMAIAKPGSRSMEDIRRLLQDQGVQDYVMMSLRIALLENNTRDEAASRAKKIHREIFADIIKRRGWTHSYEVVYGQAPPSPPPKTSITPEIVSTVTPPNEELTKFIAAGYVMSDRCRTPSGVEELVKLQYGFCLGPGSPGECAGETLRCPQCNVPACDFHGPKHRVNK